MEQVRMSALMSGIIGLCLLGTFGFAQQPANKSPEKSDSHSLDHQNVLRQMNNALQELAARVSPAVVQIQTTGYGPFN